jgi:class 3 adenylate cyclase/tetratricopeptide (TPR) repeat protein
MERKLATVLFVDLVDSSGLVARADPEVVRRRVTEYFARASRCIEQHGGMVEKFAGDAVMAAFGVPLAHEDDAERAVRSAFAIMEAVHELGLEARVGVEAGEVVVDDTDSTFATGEAVVIAARLQQAAGPGEILLGPGARRLAAGAVEVEDAGSLELKGRDQGLWTWRAVRPLDMRRHLRSAPFVGRDAEIELLENTLARTVRDGRAHLLTVYGDPGVGKSRLVHEFTAGTERATVLRGRALPYGESVTYWPLASMIKASAGIRDDDPAADAFEKLRVSCESEAVADLLAAALGVLGATEDSHSGRELQWAALRWAEQLADAAPLVLVFEDVHWAEEPLLDVIERLARSLSASPVLILCVARPELLELRPSWGGGNPRASSIDLGALAPDESEELVEALLARSPVPPAQRALLLDRAEGNPLFIEEIARMLVDAEGAEAARERIPDTVQALIAARIDRVPPEQKRLLQHAALVGRVFWRGALDRLAGEDTGTLLDALLECDFVVPEERSTISGDRAFRFKHVLIRDVAYSGMTKADRAAGHRDFAEWVAERAPDELAEIRAYHLERAARLLGELDGAPPEDLAREAAAALELAGNRALNRESFSAARRLLVRASELEPTLWRRYLAARAAWLVSDPGAADELQQLVRSAREEGNRKVEGRASLGLALAAVYGDNDVPRASDLAEEALSVIDPEDERSRYEALSMLSLIAWWRGRLEDAGRRLEEMTAIARRLGRSDLEANALAVLGAVHSELDEAVPARELTAAALAAAERAGTLEPRARALATLGSVETRHGTRDAAVAAFEEARALYEQIGAATDAGWMATRLGRMALAAGQLDDAEATARAALRLLTGVPAAGRLVEARRLLAEILVARGRIDEAERQALKAADIVSPEDAWSHAGSLSTLAVVRAAQGRAEEAERLVRDALSVAGRTEYVFLRQDLEERLAQVQSVAARA